jgi:uncharacterized protein (DUF302 family)
MFSSHLFRAPLGVPFFLAACLLIVCCPVCAEGGVVRQVVEGSDFHSAREALYEVIEAEGLVVGNALPFAQMLARTGAGQANPYREAEIIQFCSASLARQMVGEDAGQIVFCPLAIALYVTVENPSHVVMAYRAPGEESPAKVQAATLLGRLVERAGSLARLRW